MFQKTLYEFVFLCGPQTENIVQNHLFHLTYFPEKLFQMSGYILWALIIIPSISSIISFHFKSSLIPPISQSFKYRMLASGKAQGMDFVIKFKKIQSTCSD